MEIVRTELKKGFEQFKRVWKHFAKGVDRHRKKFANHLERLAKDCRKGFGKGLDKVREGVGNVWKWVGKDLGRV